MSMVIKPEYRIIVASLILLYILVLNAVGAFGYAKPDPSIMNTLIGFSSILMGVGIIKQHKAFNMANKNE